MNKKEIIFEVGYFEPTEEFLEKLHSLGYKSFTLEARMDKEMIQWIKENGSSFDGTLIYKGNYNIKYRIGFAGLLLVIPVDISKNWKLKEFGRRDLVQVAYVEVHKNEIGMTYLSETGEYDIPLKKEAVC